MSCHGRARQATIAMQSHASTQVREDTFSMSYGLGFSHQQVNRRCNTVLHGRRFKDSNFKKLGLSVLTKVKIVKSMDTGLVAAPHQAVSVIGGITEPIIHLIKVRVLPMDIAGRIKRHYLHLQH